MSRCVCPSCGVVHDTGGLTPREIAVARLVTDGLTNQEIADRLVVSSSTVRTHLLHILSKTDLSNRTKLAVAILRGELILGQEDGE